MASGADRRCRAMRLLCTWQSASLRRKIGAEEEVEREWAVKRLVDEQKEAAYQELQALLSISALAEGTQSLYGRT